MRGRIKATLKDRGQMHVMNSQFGRIDFGEVNLDGVSTANLGDKSEGTSFNKENSGVEVLVAEAGALGEIYLHSPKDSETLKYLDKGGAFFIDWHIGRSGQVQLAVVAPEVTDENRKAFEDRQKKREAEKLEEKHHRKEERREADKRNNEVAVAESKSALKNYRDSQKVGLSPEAAALKDKQFAEEDKATEERAKGGSTVPYAVSQDSPSMGPAVDFSKHVVGKKESEKK